MKTTLPLLAHAVIVSLAACEKKQTELAQAAPVASEEPAAEQVSSPQEQIAEIMESVTRQDANVKGS
jgi:hypothetical protein